MTLAMTFVYIDKPWIVGDEFDMLLFFPTRKYSRHPQKDEDQSPQFVAFTHIFSKIRKSKLKSLKHDVWETIHFWNEGLFSFLPHVLF